MSKITEQKGASNSNPSPLRRRIITFLLERASNEKRQAKLRQKREAKRQIEGRKHVVEYFHQVDDGYSHLTIQLLAKLKAQYDIEVVFHLVPGLRDDNFPEPDLWRDMARLDASNVAPYFGLSFPADSSLPSQELRYQAAQILCQLDSDQLASVGVAVSDCVWRGDSENLQKIADEHGLASAVEVNARLEAGEERRKELGHYGSANFWYEGEWYWKADRLYHLEERLQALGARKGGNPENRVAPRPAVPSEFKASAQSMTLEYYVSLRSPYTAVSWDPTMKLARDSGISLKVCPVLPMVMRGVPATVQKGMYIWNDAAREARALGVDYGRFYDPVGKPVMQGYSLYMWAREQAKGEDVIGAFLKAAFAKGINTDTQSGMRKVVELAGLDWNEARHHLDDDTWQEPLEANRKRMYEFGNWGVPSYRLLDADGKELLGVWGQDRLWLVGRKIQENS